MSLMIRVLPEVMLASFCLLFVEVNDLCSVIVLGKQVASSVIYMLYACMLYIYAYARGAHMCVCVLTTLCVCVVFFF